MLHIAVDRKIVYKKKHKKAKLLPDLNLAGYDDGRIIVDYVLIVGSIDHLKNEPEIRSLLSQLAASYNEIATLNEQVPYSLFRHKRSTKR